MHSFFGGDNNTNDCHGTCITPSTPRSTDSEVLNKYMLCSNTGAQGIHAL